MYETVIDWVRIVNVVIGMTAFIWLLLKSSSHWSHYPTTFKLYLMALLMFCWAAMYGSAEAYLLGSPVGLRTWFVLLANAHLLYALWRMRGRRMTGQTVTHRKR